MTNFFRLFLLLPLFFYGTLLHAQSVYSVSENSENGICITAHFENPQGTLLTSAAGEKPTAGVQTIDYPTADDASLPGTPKLPSKVIFIAIPPEAKIQVQLSDIVLLELKNITPTNNPSYRLEDDVLSPSPQPLNESVITSDYFPAAQAEVIGYTWIRDYYCAVLRINTHRFNWKKRSIEIIESSSLNVRFSEAHPFTVNTAAVSDFDQSLKELIVNYETASSFRAIRTLSASVDSSDDWIDYNNQYIKLQIPKDGIYQITYDTFISYGVSPVGINPRTFRIIRNGKEQPIFVSGEIDNSFDQGDLIEFHTLRNYSQDDYRTIAEQGKDYITYLDKYSDTAAVWLTWNGNEGMRVAEVNLYVPDVQDTVRYQQKTVHIESDRLLYIYDNVSPRMQLPYWHDGKTWTATTIGRGSTYNITFNAVKPFSGENGIFTARLIGYASDGHSEAFHFTSKVNNSPALDSLVFDRYKTVNLQQIFAGSRLVDGQNTISLISRATNAATFSNALFDWIDIEYTAENYAVNDSLYLKIAEGTPPALRVVKITNVAENFGNLLIYKISPELKRVTDFSISGGTSKFVTFIDTVYGGDSYLLIKKEHIQTPVFKGAKYFANLRSPNHTGEYIIITDSTLQQGAEAYKNFIESEYGKSVELIYTRDIYDEFSFGNPKAEVIRDFLQSAFTNWQSPKPSYLLMLGDANYDYKNNLRLSPDKYRRNVLPSYGQPVSDAWFAAWDTLHLEIAQLYVGRIPVSTNNDISYFLQKHQSYLAKPYSLWNKTAIFFSGGDILYPNQTQQLYDTNQKVKTDYLLPPPIGGVGTHFYKIADPPSNFGNYTVQQIDSILGQGALIISYLGHSGTQTWDNGIATVRDIQNAFSDRHPSISDFGCSTGRFAEPDYSAFGELFLLDQNGGQAISYIGNASYGYTSTTFGFPSIYYRTILRDSVAALGKAHFLAKTQMFQEMGLSTTTRVFNLCNFFFGDPILNISLPPQPNYIVRTSDISVEDQILFETDDSAHIRFAVRNEGRVIEEPLAVRITDLLNGNIVFDSTYTVPFVILADSFAAAVPVFQHPGTHTVTIEADYGSRFPETDESDNSASIQFNVYSSSLRLLHYERVYNPYLTRIRYLNPVVLDNGPESFIFSYDTTSAFTSESTITKRFDTLFTDLHLSSLVQGKRYTWRSRFNLPDANWSEYFSFVNLPLSFDWFFQGDYPNDPEIASSNLRYDSATQTWRLISGSYILHVRSAGVGAGANASLKWNGREMLLNTYVQGIASAVIDPITLMPYDIRYHSGKPNGVATDTLISYLTSLPAGTTVALTIAGDAAQEILGWSGGTPLRKLIETFGSQYIDSVRYRQAWCMIGVKGSAMGSALEYWEPNGALPADIETSVPFQADSGFISFPAFSGAVRYDSVKIDALLPQGSAIKLYPLGIRQNGIIDSLPPLTLNNGIASLRFISPALYPKLKFKAVLTPNDAFESPVFQSIGVSYTLPAELAINYQVVAIPEDSVFLGLPITINFSVMNGGFVSADSFSVLLEEILPDNSRNAITSFNNLSFPPDRRQDFSYTFVTQPGPSNRRVAITIDPDNKVTEFFEDNNSFSVPFTILSDTSKPSLALTVNGGKVFPGQFLTSMPIIKAEINDPTTIGINDTSALSLYLNNVKISYLDPDFNYSFNANNPKLSITYEPQLKDGLYQVRVTGKNDYGTEADTTGLSQYFVVSNEMKLLNLYNYPNPFTDETYFTFKLTQIPDEIRIRIFTVAGRLIREMQFLPGMLNYDFNTFKWDGRDQDGDPIANGVYFYRVIVKDGVRTVDFTEKLVKMK